MMLMRRTLRSVREIQQRAHKSQVVGCEVDTRAVYFSRFAAFEGDDVEGMAVRSEIEIERTIRPRQEKIVGRAKKEQRSKRVGGDLVAFHVDQIRFLGHSAGAAEGRNVMTFG